MKPEGEKEYKYQYKFVLVKLWCMEIMTTCSFCWEWSKLIKILIKCAYNPFIHSWLFVSCEIINLFNNNFCMLGLESQLSNQIEISNLSISTKNRSSKSKNYSIHNPSTINS